MDTFGKRLTECRMAKDLSQKELAEAFVTSQTTIGKYERDEMVPSIDVAKKLAKIWILPWAIFWEKMTALKLMVMQTLL